MPTSRPDDSTTLEAPVADALNRHAETSFAHGAEGCGERIPSPHARCQERFGPFLAAERLHRRYAVILVCNVCRTAWREEGAA